MLFETRCLVMTIAFFIGSILLLWTVIAIRKTIYAQSRREHDLRIWIIVYAWLSLFFYLVLADTKPSDAYGEIWQFPYAIAVLCIGIRLHQALKNQLQALTETVNPYSLFHLLKISLGWVLTTVLCLIYGLLIGAWIVLLVFGGEAIYGPANYGSELTRQLIMIVLPLTLPVVFLAICVVISWLCRKRGWDIKHRRRMAILVVLLAILGAMTFDSGPVKNDYTTADILPQGRDVEASYQTLMKFFKKGNSLKVTSVYDLNKKCWWDIETNITAYSEIIDRAWNDNAEARKVVDELAKFDAIADITPKVPLDMSTPILGFAALRDLASTYRFHSLLKSERGEFADASLELFQFHAVVTNAQRSVSLFLNKSFFNAFATADVETANRIVQQRDCTQEALTVLRNGFSPITGESVSLRRQLIAEYLFIRNLCETCPAAKYLDAFSYNEHPGLMRRTISSLLFYLTFKPNDTVRMLKVCYEPLIAGASQSPMKIPDVELVIARNFAHPNLNNIGGWLVLHMAIPSFARVADSASRTKVLSDLLAIELHKRLGEPFDIPDYYTGKPYFVDEKTGKLTSAGPDGIPGTKDDIQL